MRLTTALAAGVALVATSLAGALTEREHSRYRDAIQKTAAMVSDARAQELARQHGLQILNVTWEDTGRYKGSSVGPNISDMTIQVQQQAPRSEEYSLTCMPVVRYPNFSDKTADLSLDKFYLLVGNEADGTLRRVTLRDYLGNLREFLSEPGSWKGRRQSLLARRDKHVLVSAQACFLPVPKKGEAEFNPVLFNYQSTQGDPAVLTILATREGTSATIIDNTRDAFEAGTTWGQRLFYNKNGERCSLTGKRLSDHVAERKGKRPTGGDTHEAAGQSGLNMVLLIQVPLKQKNPMRSMPMFMMDEACESAPMMAGEKSDVEAAVIGHGKVEGPYTEIDNLPIERDPKFPLRVTVQFCKATSNGVVSEADLREIADQIDKVYADADYVGSLVTEGETGRPTEYEGDKTEPVGWWQSFWQRHKENTGQWRWDVRGGCSQRCSGAVDRGRRESSGGGTCAILGPGDAHSHRGALR